MKRPAPWAKPIANACPFCGENDFDLIGLKRHLAVWCEAFDKTPLNDPKREKDEDAR